MKYRTTAIALVAVLICLSACSADAEITSEVTNDRTSGSPDDAATVSETDTESDADVDAESNSIDPVSESDSADNSGESVEPASPAPDESAPDESAPAVAAPTEGAPAETVETAGSAASSSRFLATIGGAVYETDTHECFWLDDTTVTVSGEGSGPSGPFQFFMQAGQDQELSFQAGEFVVFVLPVESDLSFTVDTDVVSASVTLAVDKILEITGSCEGATVEGP